MLLQSTTSIAKSDSFITKRDRWYKVRWLLQSAIEQAHPKINDNPEPKAAKAAITTMETKVDLTFKKRRYTLGFVTQKERLTAVAVIRSK